MIKKGIQNKLKLKRKILFFSVDKKNCKALIDSEIGKSKAKVSGKLYPSIIKVGVPNIKRPTPKIDWNKIKNKTIDDSAISGITMEKLFLIFCRNYKF